MSQKLYEYSIFAKTNDIAGDDAPCRVKWKKNRWGGVGGGVKSQVEFTELKIKLSIF